MIRALSFLLLTKPLAESQPDYTLKHSCVLLSTVGLRKENDIYQKPLVTVPRFFFCFLFFLFVCLFVFLFIYYYYYYHYYYYFIDFARYHFSSVQSLDQWNSRLGEGWHDEGRFSRQPLPVFSSGGQLEQFWYRQGRLFFWTFVLISALISFMLLVTVLHFPVLTFFLPYALARILSMKRACFQATNITCF